MTSIERLLDCIGNIDDFFLTEAETADVAMMKMAKRKRIVKYSIAGAAISVGLAVASVALVKFMPAKVAKAA
jgi:hypothetical protein